VAETKEKSLEERAKKFLKFKVIIGCKKINYVICLKNKEDVPLFNYLVEKGYLIERGKTVKQFHYLLTLKGKEWIEVDDLLHQ
jgi:predicted transcriptional regulator